MAEIHIKNLWTWWIDELYGLVPEHSLSRAAQLSKQPAIRFSEGAFYLESGNAASAEDVLRRLGRRNRKVILSVPASDCLSRRLKLPKMADYRIGQILDLDILRVTPFARADIMSGWYRDAEGSIAHVMIRRRLADEAIGKLRRNGLEVAGIAILGEDGDRLPLLIEPDEGRKQKRETSRWTKAATASVFSFLLALSIWGWMKFAHQADRLAALDEQIEIVRSEAKLVRAKLDELQSRSRELSSLKLRKKTQHRSSAIWNELSSILPDNAWLQALAINGDSVSLEGMAGKPEELIARIEKSSLFANASLASAVSNIAGEGQSRFAIRAHIDNAAR
jgi:general secretion pathway protein L